MEAKQVLRKYLESNDNDTLSEIEYQIDKITFGESLSTGNIIFQKTFTEEFIEALKAYYKSSGFFIDVKSIGNGTTVKVSVVDPVILDSICINKIDATQPIIENKIEFLEYHFQSSKQLCETIEYILNTYGFSYGHTVNSYDHTFYKNDFIVEFNQDEKTFTFHNKSKLIGSVDIGLADYEDQIKFFLDITNLPTLNDISISNLNSAITYETEKYYVRAISVLMNHVIELCAEKNYVEIDVLIVYFILIHEFHIKTFIGLLTITKSAKEHLKYYTILLSQAELAAKRADYTDVEAKEIVDSFR